MLGNMRVTVITTRAGEKIRDPRPTPVLDIVIPVYNEERDLADCVDRLRTHLHNGFPFSIRITLADNANTDATLRIARTLAEDCDHVRVVHLDRKGRGRARKVV
ncbi:Glycosyl transferase family 2 [Nocardia amikacinitolerans]|nr:Glycosyl transferase family 2 [Nocardia amikacinitolerans]MCP2300041.1 Glycosyl transferase family 2 [Nocardia amikacinitolerans]